MEIDFLDPERLFSLRLVWDTAALVLIWLVQLVIYPSFQHYLTPEFRTWHTSYTRRVTYIVMPVMIGQLALYLYQAFNGFSWDIWLNLALIAGAWGITFFRAVPAHSAIGLAESHLPLAERLVRENWFRTVLWTAVWLVTVGGVFS
ncbi:MAG: hypothetical protein ACJAZ9_000998 [Neolewinella sp.]|jgi:hypothetical protein